MFVDTAKILLKAGDGGNGAVSFHREKYVPSGGPDGGDGGRGGNIVFVIDDNLSTLADFRYKRKYIAENGADGRGSNCSGKSAPDLTVRVPCGTLIKEAGSGDILADLSDPEPVIIAKGGRGGFGNQHFATPTRQCPRFAKPGTPGEQLEVILELKLLADVGLVGFPNVGKSTLISVVSEAKPKVANYHFTTLTPSLGVVRIAAESSFVMADIPGIIEGAGVGVGLGHEFLRHIERCRLLVHLVDISGSEGRDPFEDFKTINNELKVFDPELASRPQIVAGNKCDLCSDEQIQAFREFIEQQGYEFFPLIAAIADGTGALINAAAAKLATLPPIVKYEPAPRPLPDAGKISNREFTVRIEGNVFMVEAPWLLRILASVNMDDYESLQYFQTVLQKSGIIDALVAKGVQDGDTVSIYDFEFDYVS